MPHYSAEINCLLRWKPKLKLRVFSLNFRCVTLTCRHTHTLFLSSQYTPSGCLLSCFSSHTLTHTHTRAQKCLCTCTSVLGGYLKKHLHPYTHTHTHTSVLSVWGRARPSGWYLGSDHHVHDVHDVHFLTAQSGTFSVAGRE